jgi:hypothetical protein
MLFVVHWFIQRDAAAKVPVEQTRSQPYRNHVCPLSHRIRLPIVRAVRVVDIVRSISLSRLIGAVLMPQHELCVLLPAHLPRLLNVQIGERRHGQTVGNTAREGRQIVHDLEAHDFADDSSVEHLLTRPSGAAVAERSCIAYQQCITKHIRRSEPARRHV